MSCRECGCFTLLKDICSSCKRASFVFDELAINSYKSPEVESRASEDRSDDPIEPVALSPTERASASMPVMFELGGLEKDDQIPDQSVAPENLTAVAAKLGINLGDLRGVFDINELSSEIENATIPEPVVLVACQNCRQKIKRNIKCPYCGQAGGSSN